MKKKLKFFTFSTEPNTDNPVNEEPISYKGTHKAIEF